MIIVHQDTISLQYVRRIRKKLFWSDEYGLNLTDIGCIAEQCILSIGLHYPSVLLDKYVVMPNHVHMILQIKKDAQVSLSTVIGQMKRVAAKQSNREIWQKSFHDHVIRGEQDYQKIWNYIDGNPLKWKEDCFYIE